ncbi:MAG TPA: hypothetical protein VMQ11_05230 [Alphaproteobacteria bacterium]|nr:hypothetical protein [Alphaproteobacteria bacterium]
MTHHALTCQLGGTVPVQAEFVVTSDGGVELTEATVGGHVVDDLGLIGERRAGIWHSLEEILTDLARQHIATWADEDALRPDLAEPAAEVYAGSSSRRR